MRAYTWRHAASECLSTQSPSRTVCWGLWRYQSQRVRFSAQVGVCRCRCHQVRAEAEGAGSSHKSFVGCVERLRPLPKRLPFFSEGELLRMNVPV